MTERCNKGTGNCPKQYKNIGSEKFSDGKRVTADMLYQFCKNDSYLYSEVKKLWDKTDPEHRKRFHPPYYMDIAKSYGVETIKKIDVSEDDKRKFGDLEDAYHLSNTVVERYNVDFDYTNDSMKWETHGNNKVLVINDDSIIDDTSTLQVTSLEDGNGNIQHTILPIKTSKTVSNEIPFKTYTLNKITTNTSANSKNKTITKKDVYGKLTLDANCSGPYKNWTANSVWYIGYNRHKNYNIKDKWRKNPDDTSIPSVCRGQTFKAEHTGELRKVTFKMRGSSKSVSPCIVEIRTVKNGKPTQNVLARTEQKFNHSSSAMVNFTFKKPCKVTKGTTYAIVLRSPLSNFNHCYWISGWASTCFSNSRKRAYYNGETFLSEDNGKTWIVHGKKEKCYGSHYYDWGFAEAPVNFGFEVYIAPKTGTKVTTTKVPNVQHTEIEITEKTNYYTSSVMLNYYEKGDYYLYFKPFTSNFYLSLIAIYNISGNNNFTNGSYTWEIFNPTIIDGEVVGWQSFDDYNLAINTNKQTVEGEDNFKIDFEDALTFVKVRLKLSLYDNILADVNTIDDIETELSTVLSSIAEQNGLSDQTDITNWRNTIYNEFAWTGNNRTPVTIPQLRSVHFELEKKPSFQGYLRTIEYHPVQEGMLPACIWSEVDVDGVPKNNGECKIDIIHEKTAIDRILMYKCDNLELRPYILDFCETIGKDNQETSYQTNEEIQEFIIPDYEPYWEFIEYLKQQTPIVCLLPFTYDDNGTSTTIYFTGDKNSMDVELSDYPAFPINSCSVGTNDIKLTTKKVNEGTINERLVFADEQGNELEKHNFTNSTNEYVKYNTSEDLTSKIKEISILYYFTNPNDTDEIEVEALTLNENTDYVVESDKIIFNVNKQYSGADPILHDFIEIGSNISLKTGYLFIADHTEILIEMNGYDYNEFQHYLLNYNTKTIGFYNPLSLVEGEVKINYNPLWARDLEFSDFPLKMDLWTEHYLASVHDNKVWFSKAKTDKCGNVVTDELEDEHSYIRTKVPPLDNIRALEVQDINGNTKNDTLIEDIHYNVDYLTNTITFRFNEKPTDEAYPVSDGDVIMVKYTPNLTDNGLSIGYRLSRPLTNGTFVGDDWALNRSSTVNSDKEDGDDIYLFSNYFTTRT